MLIKCLFKWIEKIGWIVNDIMTKFFDFIIKVKSRVVDPNRFFSF